METESSERSSGSDGALCVVVPRELEGVLYGRLREHWDGEVRVFVDRRDGVAEPRDGAAERRKASLARPPDGLPGFAHPYLRKLRFWAPPTPRHLTDLELESIRIVERLQRGTCTPSEATGALYELAKRPLLGFIRSVDGIDPQVAEDLLHDTFTAALESLPGYELRNETSPYRWLLKIALNKAVSHRERSGRTEPRPPDEMCELIDARGHAPEPIEDERFGDEVVDSIVGSLPGRHREAFNLTKIQGFKAAEAAEIMGISEANVWQMTKRARKALKKDPDAQELRSSSRGRRNSMLIRLRPHYVIAARRFSLWREPAASRLSRGGRRMW